MHNAAEVQSLLRDICRDPSLCLRDRRVCLAGAPADRRQTLMEAIRERDRLMPIELGTPVAS